MLLRPMTRKAQAAEKPWVKNNKRSRHSQGIRTLNRELREILETHTWVATWGVARQLPLSGKAL